MRARWAAWAMAWVVCVCACAHAAPAEPPSLPPVPSTPSAAYPHCDPLLMKNPPPLPQNAREYEAAAVKAARALAELVERGAADEARAATLARAAARATLAPPPAAVALGAPQLHLGVLFVADPPRLIVFQQNNSITLRHFWKTLASAWNTSATVWAPAWVSCEGGGWWGGVAAARGLAHGRAAAAIFRRWPAVPCEPALHEALGGAPRCDADTTDCEVTPSYGVSGRGMEYRCRCRAGHWHVDGAGWVAAAGLVATPLACAPCGVASDATACLPETLRVGLLAANLAGILICLVIAIIIFKKRKCKAVAMGMWTVLEVVVLGASLMYASAASQYISDAQWRCIAGAWLRELGFVACYGSLVLRLWVLLAEFRTRKAHRWTPRDSEVLRIVGAMVIGAACYLAAFTATAAGGVGIGGGEVCARAAWHHVTAAAELLLLLAGIRIAHAARNANVPFQERRWLTAALWVEGVGGACFRAAASAQPATAAERWPVAAAARAQLSAGAALACALAPRLWHGYRARSLAQEVSRRGPAEGFGLEGEEEATSEEVRAELKRLYVQIEVMRSKTLSRDNPHISKRRGGRKAPHRRFSLQALQARRGGKGKTNNMEASEAEAGASRTPEDSVCSVEGPSHYTDGEAQA